MTSEFGKGFIYNLILFAKHWGNIQSYKYGDNSEPDYGLWFNGAADHFFELEIPDKYKDTEIGSKLSALRDLALDFRLNATPTKQDFNGFFEDLENVCMLIDKDLGVEDIKADYS